MTAERIQQTIVAAVFAAILFIGAVSFVDWSPKYTLIDFAAMINNIDDYCRHERTYLKFNECRANRLEAIAKMLPGPVPSNVTTSLREYRSVIRSMQ